MVSLIFLIFLIIWIAPASIAFFLLLIHRTHFIIEYGSLIGLRRVFLAEEFNIWEKDNPDIGYPTFLQETHNNFWTRLLRCPWCLSTWLSIFAGIFILRCAAWLISLNYITYTICINYIDYVSDIKWAMIILFWPLVFSISYLSTILYFLSLNVYKRAFSSEVYSNFV